jgi:hypothetical protein
LPKPFGHRKFDVADLIYELFRLAEYRFPESKNWEAQVVNYHTFDVSVKQQR